MSLQSYHAWDRTTRWFHWINVVCILGLVAVGVAILNGSKLGLTNDGKLLLKTIHVSFGYVFALNLLWRIIWAFIGSPSARWPAILPFRAGYMADVRAYIRGLARREPVPYLGHNPAARAIIALMIVLLVVQAVTGLVLAGTDIYFPPFGNWFAAWIAAPGVDPATIVPYSKTGVDPAGWDAMRAFRKPFIVVHWWNFFVLLTVITLHIAGVVFAELKEGGGLITAMFTGRKVFDRPPVDTADPETTRR